MQSAKITVMENNAKFAEKIREAAAEGAVLLFNKNNVLPFTDSDTVSIFGRCQIEYYKSGTGSGGSVHVPYTTNLLDGMIRQKPSGHNPLINKELSKIYKNWLKENPFDNGGGGWAAEPWNQKEMPVTQELAEDMAAISNKAVYVIGRTAGEEQDNRVAEGSYLLTFTEKQVLKNLCEAFSEVVVVLNVSNIIDTSWVKSPEYLGHIAAVLYVWHGGQEGGNATADVLCGVTTPSGKLSDTIPYSLDDYEATRNFGARDKNFYAEDIYVGYRYYETFAPSKIMYPFGYGSSYTTFSVKAGKMSEKKGQMSVVVKVKNTGKEFSGKETVQVYYEAPQARLGKPVRVLAAFAKTKLLAPGESEKIKLIFSATSMASYDDSGVSGHMNSYVLEKGDYYFYIGTDSHNTERINFKKGDCWTLYEDYVVEKLQQACAPTQEFERLKPGTLNEDGSYSAVYEKVPLNRTDIALRIKENLPKEIPFTGDVGLKFKDVVRHPAKADAFIGQLNKEELAALVRGEGMCSDKVTLGIAAAYGGLSEALHNYGIPVAGCSDGPSGIRMDNGKNASLMPIGTCLACTWNPLLVEELYECEGKELTENKIDTLLGPGMNIHRHPLNGRNFEYFSEDPMLTGEMACAELIGLRKAGAHGTIKHFATNNQETNRQNVDAIVSERALREIYLSAFKKAVTKGGAISVMTTYSPLNGHWTASNYDLVNTILHKEWGYNGLVMTDWWARMNDCVEGGIPTAQNTASMVRAHNDVYMVVDNDGAAINAFKDNIPLSLETERLTLAELQQCAKSVILFLARATVAKRPLSDLFKAALCEAKHNEAPSGEPTAVCDTPFDVPENGAKSVWLKIETPGVYKIFAAINVADNHTVGQRVCNLQLDSRPIVSFDCYGTNGEAYKRYIGCAKLEKGCYEITLDHVKPGMIVENLFFKK